MALSADFVDDPMFDAVSRLNDCLKAELAKIHGPGFCFQGLFVGDQAAPLGLADCSKGDCGVSWVRLVSMFPSTVFPQPNEEYQRCAVPMAYEIEMGVARCAPRAQGRDMFPEEQSTFDALRLYMGDAQAMKRALLCCLPAAQKAANGPDILVALGSWTPLQNAAGKSGGSWSGWIGRA